MGDTKMEVERFEEIMEENSDDYASLDDGLFHGLVLLRKYISDATIEAAEHDVIYAVGIEELCKTNITADDVDTLRAFGWHIDYDSLAYFV